MKVLVFDLDDTLYPEREFVLSGFRAVDEWLVNNGIIRGFYGVASQLFDGGDRGKIFDTALARLGVGFNVDLVRELVTVYRRHAPTLALYDDAEWALRHFRPRYELAIITDGYLETQRHKIAALGLEKMVDFVICTDALGREHWKPSPLAFEKVMAHFNCTGRQCVYFGDNPAKDFVAPNRLGWLSVLVRRVSGEHAHSTPVEGGAPAVKLVDLWAAEAVMNHAS